jgi:hypothetical protein
MLSHACNSHSRGNRSVPAPALVPVGVARLDGDALPYHSEDPAHRLAHLRHHCRVGSLATVPAQAETWLEARAGIEPVHGPFLVRVLDAVVYPDLPEWVVVDGAVVVCVGILGVYLRRYLRREADGKW